jgi:hypothetical protein
MEGGDKGWRAVFKFCLGYGRLVRYVYRVYIHMSTCEVLAVCLHLG